MDSVTFWGADPWDTGAEALKAHSPCQICLSSSDMGIQFC